LSLMTNRLVNIRNWTFFLVTLTMEGTRFRP